MGSCDEVYTVNYVRQVAANRVLIHTTHDWLMVKKPFREQMGTVVQILFASGRHTEERTRCRTTAQREQRPHTLRSSRCWDKTSSDELKSCPTSRAPVVLVNNNYRSIC